MAVEARFYVSGVGKRPSNNTEEGSIGTVTLQASTKGPNDWSQWTPSGKIELATLTPGAMEWFDERLGKDVAITFDDVPDAPDTV